MGDHDKLNSRTDVSPTGTSPDFKQTPEKDRLWHREIENILIYLELSERGIDCPDPMFFDGAFPCNGPLMDTVMDHYYGKPGGSGIVGRRVDTLADSLPRIAGGVVMSGDKDGSEMVLSAVRPVDFEAKRRLLSITGGVASFAGWNQEGAQDSMQRISVPITFSLMDRMVDVRTVKIFSQGRSESLYRGVMVRDGKSGVWGNVRADKAVPGGGGAGYGSMGFMMAVALTAEKRRSWTVTVRYQPDRPGVGLITDPVGMREFFRFRDIEPGKSRRDALLHWVNQHWRKHRVDPEAETYVREFMRGKSRFQWHNLLVDVSIPEPDTQRLEAAKRNRRKMSPADSRRRRVR